MRFDGMEFTRNRTIEAFHPELSDGPSIYCQFRYKKSGKQIFLSGHSLTNMAYGEDGRVYLAQNGSVWVSGRIRRTGAVQVPRG